MRSTDDDEIPLEDLLAPRPSRRSSGKPFGAYDSGGDLYASHTKIGFTAAAPHPDPRRERVKRELLELGGWCVILWGDVDAAIAASPERFAPSPHDSAETISMRVSGCHRNAAELHLRDPERVSVCTGYALSSDGMWRDHSWALRDEPGGSRRLYETTCSREMYHGVVLGRAESDAFARETLPEHEYAAYSARRGFNAAVGRYRKAREREDEALMRRWDAASAARPEREAEREL